MGLGLRQLRPLLLEFALDTHQPVGNWIEDNEFSWQRQTGFADVFYNLP